MANDLVMAPAGARRLVTRSDFDGLVCAALLKELGILEDILFVHPKDVQDGKVELTSNDITTNLPYCPEVALSFDHHTSEDLRVTEDAGNRVAISGADSAARVVYDYFGGAERFPRVSEEIMEAVDKADAAKFNESEILDPQGWILLSFLMDPRTGLGRFRDFRISNYNLMMQLIELCLEHSAEEILEYPDVAERVALYREHAVAAKEQILRCSTVHGRVVVLDLREEEVIHPTNRFMVYALHPQCTVSVHVLWGLRQQNTVFAVGRSIIDRSSTFNIGRLMLSYGGGGHEAAGTCQIDNLRAETILAEIVNTIDAAERQPARAEATASSRSRSSCPATTTSRTGVRATALVVRATPCSSAISPKPSPCESTRRNSVPARISISPSMTTK
jgi:nanoRNase/pAp phosphatase (c-di-AMP/oligoRNAs hydrolase)